MDQPIHVSSLLKSVGDKSNPGQGDQREPELYLDNPLLREEIAERMRAEKRLAAENSFRKAIIERAAEGLCVCHETAEFPHVRFTVWNDRMSEITGYTMDQINRLGWYQSVYPDQEVQERARERMALMRTGQDLRGEEWTVTRADGQKRTLLISTSVLEPDDSGTHVLAMMQDVTDAERAQERLERLRNELAHMARVQMMGELASGIAHELNQPLATMALWAETTALEIRAGKRISKEPLLKELAFLAEQAHRAGEIVRRMKALVRKAEPQRATLSLVDVVEEILPLVQSDLRHAGVEVEIDFDPSLPLTQVDKIQMQQVLLNLIRNALEAMHDTPFGQRRLTIRTTARSGGTEVAVRDTGCGLPGHTEERLFEAFYTTKSDGMGMGLPVTRSIIESHGGRAWAVPNPDRGATFFFTVPTVDGGRTEGSELIQPG